MSAQDLQRTDGGASLLTNPARLERLVVLMAEWWQGSTLARMAREHGVSRQRVSAMLARVGCTRRLWRMADHHRPGSGRRAALSEITQARAALLHPLAHRLTVRQRAALGWRVQALVLVDIGRRMHCTPQNVQRLLVAGRWRLERLSQPKHRPAMPEVECLPLTIAPPDYKDLLPAGWDEVLAGMAAPASPPKPAEGANAAAVGHAGPAGRTSVAGERPVTPRGQAGPSGGRHEAEGPSVTQDKEV